MLASTEPRTLRQELEPIPFEDLLASPWLEGGDDPVAGIDCCGIWRECSRRADLVAPKVDVRDLCDTAHPLWAALEYVGPTHADAKWQADALVTAHPESGNPCGIWTLVVPSTRWAITAYRADPEKGRVGGVFSQPVHRIDNLIGVWRIPR